VRQQYGRLLRERGRLEASEHELRIVVEQQSPGETSARVGLAETLIDLGKTDEAGRLIDGVLEKDPKLADALAAKGRLLRAQGRAGEAVDFLQRAAESGAPDPTIELGIALLDSGNPQGAGEAAGRILARTPAHPWALTILGESLIREGRREEGLQVLQRALAAPPRRVEVWQSLARAFKAAGDTPSAERCLREARALAG
jgi:Flp pilus assembly protein TadD